ncbi:MAG: GAF domain-containing protein [Propionicimonas sp.]|uniref:GAF domain-containing protein n=1 Tax=Propionicimonas sp. TaxID=1955623 RepID=UPI003D101148
MTALTALCALVRWSTGAAAVSLATVAEDHLLYVAADGAGAEAITGTRLPAGRGIAGFAAATGQSLTVRDPGKDPRFARDTAEATGYVPVSLQCVPVEDADGEVIGVLSILDRSDTPLGPGVPGVPLEQVTTIAAALLDGGHTDGAASPLAGLSAADRERAADVLRRVLDSLTR